MNCRIRGNSTRPTATMTTNRFKEYLKPGALARLRDSKISTRSHRQYILVAPLINSVAAAVESPSQLAELPPEFPSLGRGPQCFGRRKLVAAKFVADSSAVNSVVSANSNNLLVH
ncbi:hypothetical protein RND81_09G047700 [Saponaria officinalis]|uniref:Uncharacterized protein n=1 Tax=Saponaria officinalis TaxID=3572 RepID=A0AAW1IIE3_SAPOF